MSKFKKLLDEAEVVFGDKKKRVPTDQRGKPLSVAMQRIMKASKEIEGKSGFKLMTALRAILNQMREFETAVRKLPANNNGYDSIKHKVRKDFAQAMTDLSNMVFNVKKKGLKAVENNNEEMELWENLENSCKNIVAWMKNSSSSMVGKSSDKS
jgi:hypothetical protein